MEKMERRCWKPLHPPPKFDETDCIFNEEEISVLQKLYKRYNQSNYFAYLQGCKKKMYCEAPTISCKQTGEVVKKCDSTCSLTDRDGSLRCVALPSRECRNTQENDQRAYANIAPLQTHEKQTHTLHNMNEDKDFILEKGYDNFSQRRDNDMRTNAGLQKAATTPTATVPCERQTAETEVKREVSRTCTSESFTNYDWTYGSESGGTEPQLCISNDSPIPSNSSTEKIAAARLSKKQKLSDDSTSCISKKRKIESCESAPSYSHKVISKKNKDFQTNLIDFNQIQYSLSSTTAADGNTSNMRPPSKSRAYEDAHDFPQMYSSSSTRAADGNTSNGRPLSKSRAYKDVHDFSEMDSSYSARAADGNTSNGRPLSKSRAYKDAHDYPQMDSSSSTRAADGNTSNVRSLSKCRAYEDAHDFPQMYSSSSTRAADGNTSNVRPLSKSRAYKDVHDFSEMDSSYSARAADGNTSNGRPLSKSRAYEDAHDYPQIDSSSSTRAANGNTSNVRPLSKSRAYKDAHDYPQMDLSSSTRAADGNTSNGRPPSKSRAYEDAHDFPQMYSSSSTRAADGKTSNVRPLSKSRAYKDVHDFSGMDSSSSARAADGNTSNGRPLSKSRAYEDAHDYPQMDSSSSTRAADCNTSNVRPLSKSRAYKDVHDFSEMDSSSSTSAADGNTSNGRPLSKSRAYEDVHDYPRMDSSSSTRAADGNTSNVRPLSKSRAYEDVHDIDFNPQMDSSSSTRATDGNLSNVGSPPKSRFYEDVPDSIEFYPQMQSNKKAADGNTSNWKPPPFTKSYQDIQELTYSERERSASRIRTCRLMSFFVMYEDTTVNTSSIDQKIVSVVKGILMQCEDTTFFFPILALLYTVVSDWSRDLLRAVLIDDNIIKIAVNCKELVKTLVRYYEIGANREALFWSFQDPIVAGYLLCPDDPPTTLETVALLAKLKLDPRKGYSPCLTLCINVMERLRLQLLKQRLWTLFYHLEMPLTPLVAVMEMQTIKVNSSILLKFSDILQKKIDKITQLAYELAGHSFLINSTEQLRQVLYTEMKLDNKLPENRVPLTAISHRKSTSGAILRQLEAVHELPTVVLQYRHMLKLKRTYVDGILEFLETGTVHTHWDQMICSTGRLVSSRPNLQAIPKTATYITNYEDNLNVDSEDKPFELHPREPYVTNKGNIFLAADFQQIELRLLAHLTNDSGFIEMFSPNESSADVFVQLTAQWLAKPCADVTGLDREKTKRVVYSIIYGIGKEKLAEYLNVNVKRAKDIMESFFVTFPSIRIFTQNVVARAKKFGYTLSLMGRRRWFPRVAQGMPHIRTQAGRKAINFCVQGSAADLCKNAMLKVEQSLAKQPHLKARLLLNIHDELLWELPKEQLKETHDLIKSVLEDNKLLCQPLTWCLRVPITVSMSAGTSWAHLKPYPPKFLQYPQLATAAEP